MKLLKTLLTVCLVLLSINMAFASSVDIRPGEPGSSSSKKATIVTSYQSNKMAKDSVIVILQNQGYKLTSCRKTKIKGYKPVSSTSPKCHCDESDSCNSGELRKSQCRCQTKKNLFSIFSSNSQKTPTICAEIHSSRKQITITLSSKLRSRRIEPPTDIESISMNLTPKEITLH
ncbi:MAG: hypothetical protein MJZ16_06750 [Bacteroidales bacterium]|nr:hypothetical protein [Bacteroidales bacterium]